MLHALVGENCSAPGTTDFTLTGAIPGSVTWASRFANGAACFYLATDSATPPNYEAGVGSYSTSPAKVHRTTVTENSLNTTAKINFTGAVKVINFLASSNALYVNDAGVVEITAPLNLVGATTLTRSGAGEVLTIFNPSNTGVDGAQIKLEGTNYSAFMSVVQTAGGSQGWFRILNGAYSIAGFHADQSGNAGVAGTFTSGGKMVAGAPGTTGNDLLRYDQFPATLAAPGSQRFPNLLQYKWGYAVAAGGTGSGTFTFSPAFPTDCFVALGFPDGASGVIVGRSAMSASSCTFTVRNTAGIAPAFTTNIAVLAIGY